MNKKITLTNFWLKKDKKVAVNTKTKEEAKTLISLSNKLGKAFDIGRIPEDEDGWDDYQENTCYSNDGLYGEINDFKGDGYTILDFKDINLETKSLIQKNFAKNIGQEVYVLINTFDTKGKNIKVAKGIIIDFEQEKMTYTISFPYAFSNKMKETNLPIIQSIYNKPTSWSSIKQIIVPITNKNNYRLLLKRDQNDIESPYIFTFTLPDISKIYRNFLNTEKRYKTHLSHIKEKYPISMLFVKRNEVKTYEEFEELFFKEVIFFNILSPIDEEDFKKCFYFSDSLKQDLKKLYYYFCHQKEFVFKNLEKFENASPFIKFEYPVLKDKYGVLLNTNKITPTRIGACLLNIIKDKKEIEPKLKIKANITMFCKFNSSVNSEYCIDINKVYKFLNKVKFVPVMESEINNAISNEKEEPTK